MIILFRQQWSTIVPYKVLSCIVYDLQGFCIARMKALKLALSSDLQRRARDAALGIIQHVTTRNVSMILYCLTVTTRYGHREAVILSSPSDMKKTTGARAANTRVIVTTDVSCNRGHDVSDLSVDGLTTILMTIAMAYSWNGDASTINVQWR